MENDTLPRASVADVGDAERELVAEAMQTPAHEPAPPPEVPTVDLDAYLVTFGDEDDPTTWVQLRTVVIPKDSTRASAMVAKHPEWGEMSKNPIPFLNAQIFYSLKRKGRYTASFDQFMDEALDFTKVDSERVDPTQPATGSD